jgi:3-oxoacyl-[acyl-carrier protein] reductase/meso-butanediol dehydrogenase/(S,S)-butanediol dehydrogenase/diacetyl reductase
VAIVTGAARPKGIGRATALELARRGADVACVDLASPVEAFPTLGMANEDDLESVVAEVRALGRRAVAIRADMTSSQQVTDAFERSTKDLGPVDICCNVAGGVAFGAGVKRLTDLSESEWDFMLDLNLKSAWLMSRACAVGMIANGRPGAIVNVASAAGLHGSPKFGAYGAAKAAVIHLTQTLALELGPHGIRVNCVCPGMVETSASEPMRERMAVRAGGMDNVRELGGFPLRRFARAEEIASGVVFLASDFASYISGAALNMTGAQVLD